MTRITIGYPDERPPAPNSFTLRNLDLGLYPPQNNVVDWLIAHAFWILGAAALLIGVLLSLHSALHAIRLRSSVLACALVAVSAVLWPIRLWMVQHRPMGIADPAIHWIVTTALWLAIAAVPLAVIGRPRFAPFILIASAITFVFWYRTAVPRETSVWTMLHISNPISRADAASSPAKPSPALTNSSHQTTPTPTRPASR